MLKLIHFTSFILATCALSSSFAFAQSDDSVGHGKILDPEGPSTVTHLGDAPAPTAACPSPYQLVGNQCYYTAIVSETLPCPTGMVGFITDTTTEQVHDTAYDGLGIIISDNWTQAADTCTYPMQTTTPASVTIYTNISYTDSNPAVPAPTLSGTYTSPVAWSIATGSVPGMSLDSGGNLVGTPTTVGVDPLTYKAVSTDHQSVQTGSFTVSVVSPSSLCSSPYTNVTQGGTGGITCYYIANGSQTLACPSGQTGSITQTDTTTYYEYPLASPVSYGSSTSGWTTASNTCTAIATGTLAVATPPSVTIYVGTTYSDSSPAVSAPALSGTFTSPVTWAIASGAVPGMSLDSSGNLVGSPTTAGVDPLVYSVKSADNQTATTNSFNVTVVSASVGCPYDVDMVLWMDESTTETTPGIITASGTTGTINALLDTNPNAPPSSYPSSWWERACYGKIEQDLVVQSESNFPDYTDWIAPTQFTPSAYNTFRNNNEPVAWWEVYYLQVPWYTQAEANNFAENTDQSGGLLPWSYTSIVSAQTESLTYSGQYNAYMAPIGYYGYAGGIWEVLSYQHSGQGLTQWVCTSSGWQFAGELIPCSSE